VPLTPWNTSLGSGQGRTIPTNFPADDTWSFVLGSDEVGRFVFLNVGDHADVFAVGDFSEVTVVRFHGRIRGPASYPAGVIFRASLLIDGVTYATRLLYPARQRDLFDMGANVAVLAPGDHELRFSLELVST